MAVVPINTEDVMDVHQLPFPSNVNNDSKSIIKAAPRDASDNKENSMESSSAVSK